MDNAIFHFKPIELMNATSLQTPSSVVELISGILFAEAHRVGLPQACVHVPNTPSAVSSPDGGIDGTVEIEVMPHSTLNQNNPIFSEGLFKFQIKAGKFSATKSAMESELLKESKLKPRILQLLEQKGTYIFVVFKDVIDRRDLKKIISTIFSSAGFPNSKIEIWDLGQICEYMNKFPSLVLQYKPVQFSYGFETQKTWQLTDGMQRQFHAGKNQEKRIQSIQSILKGERNETEVIQVVGEPGIGKTRLVLEATKDERLEPSVVYTKIPEEFINFLLPALKRIDSKQSGIFVVDNCSLANLVYIEGEMRNLGARIAIITILSENLGNKVLRILPLEDALIVKILKSFHLKNEKARHLAQFCDGFPKVAYLFGKYFSKKQKFSKVSYEIDNFWKNAIIGDETKDSITAKIRMEILKILALFKTFSFSNDSKLQVEKDGILALIKRFSNISESDINNAITFLKSKGLVTGSYVYWITPKAFKIWLWKEWWKNNQSSFDPDIFGKLLPKTLLEGMYEMFVYSKDADLFPQIIRKLLKKEGPFGNDRIIKTESGRLFFLAISEAHPRIAMVKLTGVIETWKAKDFSSFTERRKVVFALEILGQFKTHFCDTMDILLKFAEHENESWSNNATGVFIEFFSAGWGDLAPTEMPLEYRLNYLKTKLEDGNFAIKPIILDALGNSLNSDHFTQGIAFNKRSLNFERNLWKPKTYGDLYKCYEKAWIIIEEHLSEFEQGEKDKAIDILSREFRKLVLIESCAERILCSMKHIASEFPNYQIQVLEAIITTLYYEEKILLKNPELKTKLEDFYNKLLESDFTILLKRYVGTYVQSDRYPANSSFARRAERDLKKITQALLEDEKFFDTNIEWLLSNKAKRANWLGHRLAINDINFKLTKKIVFGFFENGFEPENFSLIEEYISEIQNQNYDKWESIVKIAIEKKGYDKLPFLIVKDLSASTLSMLFEKICEGKLTSEVFRWLRSVNSGLSNDIILKLLNVLSNSSAEVALGQVEVIYNLKKDNYKIGKTLFNKFFSNVVKHNKSLHRRNIEFYQFYEVLGYYSKTIKKLDQHKIFKVLLNEISGEGLFSYNHPYYVKALDNFALYNLKLAWKEINKKLRIPIDSELIYIKSWLKGSFANKTEKQKTGIELFSFDIIDEVLDKNDIKKMLFVVWCLPNYLFKNQSETLSLSILKKYGDIKDVRFGISTNVNSSVIVGPFALHYQDRLKFYQSKLKGSNHKFVKMWLNEEIESLEQGIEPAKLHYESVLRRHTN